MIAEIATIQRLNNEGHSAGCKSAVVVQQISKVWPDVGVLDPGMVENKNRVSCTRATKAIGKLSARLPANGRWVSGL